MMDSLISAVQEGDNPSPDFVRDLAKTVVSEETAFVSPETGPAAGGPAAGPSVLQDAAIHIPHGFGKVFPRGRNQAA
jgi:phosphate starvation-inducible PhoH-like protein